MSELLEIAASGIVLAGGRSRRYGSDKLAVRVGGATLLDRSVAALAVVAVDVVVVVAPGDRRVPAAIERPLRVVSDPELHGGPLVGLLAGLEAVGQPLAVVVGGDMPNVREDVLRLMLRTLAAVDDAFGAVILERRGRGEPLPAAVRTGSATDVARRLVADGERSLRSLFERLPTRIIDEASWRPLDPEAATLRDVDRPSDLEG